MDSMKSLNSSMQTAVIAVLTIGAFIVLTRTFSNVVNFLLIIKTGFPQKSSESFYLFFFLSHAKNRFLVCSNVETSEKL